MKVIEGSSSVLGGLGVGYMGHAHDGACGRACKGRRKMRGRIITHLKAKQSHHKADLKHDRILTRTSKCCKNCLMPISTQPHHLRATSHMTSHTLFPTPPLKYKTLSQLNVPRQPLAVVGPEHSGHNTTHQPLKADERMDMDSNSPTPMADMLLGLPKTNNHNDLLTMMAQGFRQLTENFIGQFQSLNKHIDKIKENKSKTHRAWDHNCDYNYNIKHARANFGHPDENTLE